MRLLHRFFQLGKIDINLFVATVLYGDNGLADMESRSPTKKAESSSRGFFICLIAF